jgi:hypothetical protein
MVTNCQIHGYSGGVKVDVCQGSVIAGNGLFDIDGVGVWMVNSNATLNGPVVIGNTMEIQGGGGGTYGGILIDDCTQWVVAGNTIYQKMAGYGIRVAASCSAFVMVGNQIFHEGNGLNGIEIDSSSDGICASNLIYSPARHGIYVNIGTRVNLRDNYMLNGGTGTANTYDGIHLVGNSDDCTIMGNVVHLTLAAGNRWRYGLNVSAAACDRTIYVANTCRPAANFATGAYNDAGTGSINLWPGAAAPQGDNMV